MKYFTVVLIGCLVAVWVAVLFPSHGFAKPRLDVFGNCAMPAKCAYGVSPTCAQLYCRALKEKCKGVYTSGKCKEIKDLHNAADCSKLAKKGCGDTLPRILTIGDLQVDIASGDVFVVTDPEDEAVDFSVVFDAAATSAALLDPKTCLDRCLSKVSKECDAACREICAPGQD